MLRLQALRGRLVQAFPLSFGSLRLASSFKVMRKIIAISFPSGKTYVITLKLELQSGVAVNAWIVTYKGKKEVTFFLKGFITWTSCLLFTVPFLFCVPPTLRLL